MAARRFAVFRAFQKEPCPIWTPPTSSACCRKGHGARGMTVEAYRDLIQATADRAGVSFATALQVISLLDKMPSGVHLAGWPAGRGRRARRWRSQHAPRRRRPGNRCRPAHPVARSARYLNLEHPRGSPVGRAAAIGGGLAAQRGVEPICRRLSGTGSSEP